MTDTKAETAVKAEEAKEAKAEAAEVKAETKAAAETKAEAKEEARPTRKAALGRAGESGDPYVQRLLAMRQGHELSVTPDPSLAAQREAAKKAIADIDKELADLGFTAE